MTFDKNLILGFAAGVVAGCLGAKYYSEHKDELDAKFKGLKDSGLFKKIETVAEDAELTLEELEAQKERLEDLIADVQSRKTQE
ncbi:MAG: hypothetical protein K6F05_06965 [Succinivibrio sp.]|nr:hypothetical protein [Succinivibrio sp.]